LWNASLRWATEVQQRQIEDLLQHLGALAM
jgi:hypothetical protein